MASALMSLVGDRNLMRFLDKASKIREMEYRMGEHTDKDGKTWQYLFIRDKADDAHH